MHRDDTIKIHKTQPRRNQAFKHIIDMIRYKFKILIYYLTNTF